MDVVQQLPMLVAVTSHKEAMLWNHRSILGGVGVLCCTWGVFSNFDRRVAEAQSKENDIFEMGVRAGLLHFLTLRFLIKLSQKAKYHISSEIHQTKSKETVWSFFYHGNQQLRLGFGWPGRAL